MSITATPPGFVPILKDGADCWCDRLERRFAHQGLIDRSSAIDRRGHVDLSKRVALVDDRRSIGVEICKDGDLGLEGHDGGTVKASVRIQQMDTGVTAGNFGEVMEGQRGAEKEAGHEGQQDCDENSDSEHVVLSCSLRLVIL